MEIKKIIIAPDSFKGTASAQTAAKAMEAGVKSVLPEAEIVLIPIADGGEGTLDAFGCELVKTSVTDPFFNITESFFGITEDNTAIIEMAAAAGYVMAQGNKNPEITTTYGVGDLIYEAAQRGCKNIIVGLGGSCTNDGGAGIAAALGVRFIDRTGNLFVPTGGTLCDIEMIDMSGILPIAKELNIIAMCDVKNTLCGENGASYVFAPQKGADSEMIKRLEAGMLHYAKCVERACGVDILDIVGGGAAGGCAAGLCAFFSAKIQSGIELILNRRGFDKQLADTSLVITGEGKFDSQSEGGKAVDGVVSASKKCNVPVAVVCGIAEFESYAIEGIAGVYPIRERVTDEISIKENVYEDIKNTTSRAITDLISRNI